MITNTLEAPSVRDAWAPTLFKVAASATFATGFAIHTTRLIIGVERIVREVMTPPVDIAFGFLILTAAIPGVMSWRRYSGGRAGRILYGFMMFILVVSVPIHFRTMLTWSTEYLTAFPVWYSAAEVPMFLALSYLAARLKFD
jgi:hypothetical protein